MHKCPRCGDPMPMPYGGPCEYRNCKYDRWYEAEQAMWRRLRSNYVKRKVKDQAAMCVEVEAVKEANDGV